MGERARKTGPPRTGPMSHGPGPHKNKSRVAGRGPRPLPSPARRKGRRVPPWGVTPVAAIASSTNSTYVGTVARLEAVWKTPNVGSQRQLCVLRVISGHLVGSRRGGESWRERIGAQCLSHARKTASAGGPGIGYLRDGQTDAVRACRRHAGCHRGTWAVAGREHGSYHGAEPAAAGSLDLRRDTQLLRRADAGTRESRGRSHAGQRRSPLPRGHSLGFHIVGGGRHVRDARVERRAF